MLLPKYAIETARLTLRYFAPGDFDGLYAYQSCPDVARYLYWDARDRAQAQHALERQCRERTLDAEGDWLTFAVVWREAGRVVGEVGLRLLSREHRQEEAGFVFNPGYHGRGPSYRARRGRAHAGIRHLGAAPDYRLPAAPRNHRSARLMERTGMRRRRISSRTSS